MLEVRRWLSRNQILEAAELLEMCISGYFYSSDYFLKILLRGYFKCFPLNHTENRFPCMLCEELSNPMKVWGKALLFSVGADLFLKVNVFRSRLSGCHCHRVLGRVGFEVLRVSSGREPDGEAVSSGWIFRPFVGAKIEPQCHCSEPHLPSHGLETVRRLPPCVPESTICK